MDDIKPALQELSESSSSSISISTTSSISSTTTTTPPSSTTTYDTNADIHTTPSWPRIGSVVAETEIPAAWRKTKLQSEMQHQYVFLGAVCGIFFVGVLGVLMCSWCSCWWRGDCFWTRRGRPRRSARVGSEGRLMKWYG